MRRGLVSVLIACAAAFAAHGAAVSDQFFTEKVKPLLDSRCISCHGPDKTKGGLRLDSRAALLKGGETGPAIIPGKPEESLLIQAVMHSKKDLEMPPRESLTTNDVAVFRRWIADGAPWPTNAASTASAPEAKPGEQIGDAWHDQRNPIVRIFGGQRLDLWSVKPLSASKKVISGAVITKSASAKGGATLITSPLNADYSSPNWPRNPIDKFILAKLKDHKLHPSPEADRRTLIRRLSFDLTGLPPAAERVAAFVADKRADAYERLVDELLASPRYGEHMARQWMDVIRYSDSNGFDWDEFRPRAWRFRDYLIRSFNSDKPFDQFVREQLAGDELVDGAPASEPEQDCLIATGYLRMGPQDNSAPLFNEQSRARAELMADLTETTSSAFLGLTVSCCRCHDHKYDPLSQADHYRLRAFFEPVKYGDDIPLDLASAQEQIRVENKKLDDQINPLKARRDDLLNSVKKKLRDGKVAQLQPEEKALLSAPPDKQTDEQKVKVAAIEKKLQINDKAVTAALSAEQKKENDALGKQIETLTRQKRAFTSGLLATDNPEKVPVTKILSQGDYRAERDPVQPGFLSILDPNPAAIHKGRNARTTGRRLTLANWIASTNNPLTARVLVNRVWQSHFGKGLVATPNDFGLAGTRPTHPELLDWLSAEFMRGGWSVKSLHRLIVTSATYRQAAVGDSNQVSSNQKPVIKELIIRKSKIVNGAAVDAENTLLWRQNVRRLSAEQLRDAVLAVSGLLKLDHTGGPPVWPELPPEILQANPAFLDDNAEKTKGWYPSARTNQNVRSVYLVQKRTVRVPFMETFDMPENSVSCARRNESTVAPQALSLLNGALTIDAAKALAERVKRDAGDDPARQVERVFAFVLQRSPDAEEVKRCAELTQSHSLTELCRALLNLNEFLYVD